MKVDRDERPDVDSRYQLAVSAIAGTGGWPLTVFLTPDGRPFYGGTYFPPDDRWGRPSFKKILLAIAEAYRERRDEVLKSADETMNMLASAEGFAGRQADFSPRIVGVMVQSALPIFDEKNGGFGSAPKFPHPAALDLLLDWYVRTRRRAGGHRHHDDADQDGAGRSVRPARRWLSSLLGGRALDCSALREDVVRQLGAAEELRPRLPGVRLRVLRARCARYRPLDGRVAERSASTAASTPRRMPTSTSTTTATTSPGPCTKRRLS